TKPSTTRPAAARTISRMSPPLNGDVELEADGVASGAWPLAPPVLLAPAPPLPEAPDVPEEPPAVLPPVAWVPPPPVTTVPPAPPEPLPVTGSCVSGATPWYCACELDCAQPDAGTVRATSPTTRQ